MSGGPALNPVEQLVLLALAHLPEEEGYGVTIRQAIEDRSGIPVSTTAVYAALERLERRELVRSWLSAPLPERGGRARKLFRLLPAGARLLRQEREAVDRMWAGLESHPLLGDAER